MAAVAFAVLVGAAAAGGQQTNALVAVVGPGFSIALTKADGVAVTNLDPGEYTIAVSDRSAGHSFHLRGPSVDMQTGVEAVEEQSWTVALANGEYSFFCDMHPIEMRGTFTVGAVQPPAAPPAPPKPQPVRVPVLLASVGPGSRILLANAAGRRIATVKAGLYDMHVRDRSVRDNFHLVGPGVNRKTTLAGRVAATWRVRLAKGKTYGYRSDRTGSLLRGTLRAL